MNRPWRIEYAGALYHLLSRGNQRSDIFVDEKDRSSFLDAVGEIIYIKRLDNCMDNIFIERLWRSVKYEKIFLKEFETVKELIAGLKEYFEFYNFERPHQSFSGKTSAEEYWGNEVAKKAA